MRARRFLTPPTPIVHQPLVSMITGNPRVHGLGNGALRWAVAEFDAERPQQIHRGADNMLTVWKNLIGQVCTGRSIYLIRGVCVAPLAIGSFKYTSPLRILMLKPHSGLLHTHAL